MEAAAAAETAVRAKPAAETAARADWEGARAARAAAEARVKAEEVAASETASRVRPERKEAPAAVVGILVPAGSSHGPAQEAAAAVAIWAATVAATAVGPSAREDR